MQPVADQVFTFILLILLGNLVGVIFDIYRFVRQIRRLKRWGTNLGDALFWVVITVVTYLFLLEHTWGEVRVYVFVAMVIGLGIYLKCFSYHFGRALFRIYLVFLKFLRVTMKICGPPLKILAIVLLFPVRFSATFLYILLRGFQRTGRIIGDIFRYRGNIKPPQGPTL